VEVIVEKIESLPDKPAVPAVFAGLFGDPV
jgi:hypothetical protein